MAKKLKINKGILRCEYGEIAPDEYVPDWDIQAHFNPSVIIEAIHEYVLVYMDEHFFFVGDSDKAKEIKKTSVHRVLLTKALLAEVHKRPKWQKDIVFELEETDKVLEILDSCIEDAADTLDPNLTWKEINIIWNMIKCAYGSAYAPPNAAIFENFVQVYI